MENMAGQMNFNNFKGKKILITGHTGFKGSWLSIWLLSCGADVVGYSLDPKTDKDNFVVAGLKNKMKDYRGDIRDKKNLKEVFDKEKPEIIFHLAAQPLVLDSFSDPQNTFEINIQGTVNILEEFRKSSSAEMLIVITTDKVYENKNWVWGYRENDRLGGADPYSASKSAVELIIASYNKSFFKNLKSKKVVSARAGNVIGGGDWSANRIIPDCIRALEDKNKIIIRNPGSVRPWQFVLEPLYGYLMLADKILQGDIELDNAWNFGPAYNDSVSVLELVKKILIHYGEGDYEISKESVNLKEAELLLLDTSKAQKILNWEPVLSIEEAITMTMEWYSNYTSGSVYELCLKQIKDYTGKWKLKN
jgi:CDP-glucose 4,6-dehydratase